MENLPAPKETKIPHVHNPATNVSQKSFPGTGKLLRYTPQIITVAVLTVISIVISIFSILNAIYFFLASIFTIVGIAFCDYQFTPKYFKRLQTLFLEARGKSLYHPIMKIVYNETKNQFESSLRQLSSNYFISLLEDVPNISKSAMQIVDKTCILLYPPSSVDILDTDRIGAKRYYDEMKQASLKISTDHQNRQDTPNVPGLTRIFILDDYFSVGLKLWRFIVKNKTDLIHVRFMLKSRYKSLKKNNRYKKIEYDDFGFYETKSGARWIMAINPNKDDSQLTMLIISAAKEDTELYHDFAHDIIVESDSYDEFLGCITKPLNHESWENYFFQNPFKIDNAYKLDPPHGLSDEDAAQIVASIESFDRSLPQTTSLPIVLVLGRTPRILDLLSDALKDQKLSRVFSIDYCRGNPKIPGITYVTGNWLNMSLETFKADSPIDLIMFDESINNLSEVQFILFLENLKSILKPGSQLIGRIMGRFDKKKFDAYNRMTAADALLKLRNFGGSTHSEVSPLIICLLHSEDMAYDKSKDMISCSRWNDSIEKLANDSKNYITAEELDLWTLKFDFTLFSPDYNFLIKTAKEFGFEASRQPVLGGYASQSTDINDFYSVMKFTYNPRL